MEKPLKNGPDTKIFAFLLAVRNAREAYILARVGLIEGLCDTGCLLAQQCLESCIKAALRIYWREIKESTGKDIDNFVRGHNLVGLMRRALPYIPEYKKILDDSQKKDFLNELTKIYDSTRFGESGLSIDCLWSLRILDDLFSETLNLYRHHIKLPKQKIFVPKNLQMFFLASNERFTAEEISDNPLETLGS